jgi:hypothetical protein
MPNGTATADAVPIDTGMPRFHLSSAGALTPLPGGDPRRKEELGFSGELIVLDASGIAPFAHKVSNVLRLSQSELYPIRHAFSPEHITALRLLGLAVGRTQRALTAMNDGDEIAADSETQKVQVLLPELFCCRSLGDGFGSVVNGLLGAFESLQGNPPSVPQLRKLNQVFILLRDKPFLSADEADEQLGQLESVNLSPYPAELVEFLSSGEGVR